MPAMFKKWRKSLDVFWDRMNPIVVLELSRGSPLRELSVLPVSVLPLLPLTLLVPGLREVVLGYYVIPFLCLCSMVLGVFLASISSAVFVSKCRRDPLMEAVPLSPRERVWGSFCLCGFVSCCMILPCFPVLLLTALAAARLFPSPGIFEDISKLCLGLGFLTLPFFLWSNALGAYFFSFYSKARSSMQENLVILAAFAGPALYALPWCCLPWLIRYFHIPYCAEEFADYIYIGAAMAAMVLTYVVAWFLSLRPFRRPKQNIFSGVFVNLLVYTILSTLFAAGFFLLALTFGTP